MADFVNEYAHKFIDAEDDPIPAFVPKEWIETYNLRHLGDVLGLMLMTFKGDEKKMLDFLDRMGHRQLVN